MAPSWIALIPSTKCDIRRICVPATIVRFFWSASSDDAITERTPTGSTATGFSINTCLPASIAAFRCPGRKCGGSVSITMSTSSHATTFLCASQPTKHLSCVTFTLLLTLVLLLEFSEGGRLSVFRHLSRRSLKRSPIATSSTFSEDLRHFVASCVPRPPHPIRPMRTLSEPAANILFVPTAKLAAPSAAEVLIKSLRDKSDFPCVIILVFISYPFKQTIISRKFKS